MPISSVCRVQQNQMLSSRTPASELVWVHAQIDGQTSIPAAEVARTCRWKRGHMRKDVLARTAVDIVDVQSLAEPLSYTLQTLSNGQEMWVPLGRDAHDYSDEVAMKLGITITPPPTAPMDAVEETPLQPLPPLEGTGSAEPPAAATSSAAVGAAASNRERYEELCSVYQVPVPAVPTQQQPTAPSAPRSTPANAARQQIQQKQAGKEAAEAPTAAAEAEGKALAAEAAAEAALKTAAQTLFPLVQEAAALRMRCVQPVAAVADPLPQAATPGRIYLRGVRSRVRQFMPEDKAAAMARYPWYRRQVRRQLQLLSLAAVGSDSDRASPIKQRRPDEGVWAVVPDPESDPRWECYLQPAPGAHGQCRWCSRAVRRCGSCRGRGRGTGCEGSTV